MVRNVSPTVDDRLARIEGQVDERLTRIEGKMDRLADALHQLVRVEERQLSVQLQLDEAKLRLRQQADQIAALERQIVGREGFLATWERMFWLTVAAALSVMTWFLTGRS